MEYLGVGWKAGLVTLLAVLVAVFSGLWLVTRPPGLPAVLPPPPPEPAACPDQLAEALCALADDMRPDALNRCLEELQSLPGPVHYYPSGLFFSDPAAMDVQNEFLRKLPHPGLVTLAQLLVLRKASRCSAPQDVIALCQQIAALPRPATGELARAVAVLGHPFAWSPYELPYKIGGLMPGVQPPPVAKGAPTRTWLESVVWRDRAAGEPMIDQISDYHDRLVGAGRWPEYHARRLAVEAWQARDEWRLFSFLASALHPGRAAATRREGLFEPELVDLLLAQGHYEALRLRLARELWQRSHPGEPGPDLVSPWPRDPFDPGRQLKLVKGDVWSVGPDQVDDGMKGSGLPADFGFRGDVKL